ncbi:MAG: AAA family ATPase, partial [Gammaproteobacteria bacterium]|nr:AAA family ATPase [Gammaproteobacteria bacterium]
MLARIHINNLAVIDEVELEFESGMTALTGETGAGKSILVDALALALGERADSKAVRTGTDRCTVTATFDIKEAGHVTRWLQAHDLDADDECIIRRVVSADGRSRGYLNGNNVPMQTLREIGEQLLDICGQQAHQSLRHPRMQQELLDGFGGHESLLKKMADAFADWQNLHAELTSLQEAQDDRSARLDLLTYQVAELNALNLGVDELTSIDQEHARIANAGRIASALENALAELYETESGSAYAVLSSTKQTFTELGEIDTRLSPLAEMLSEAEILIAETASVIREQQDALEHDPARLQQLEQRLSDIHELARKHRIEASALPALTVKLNEELSQIESSDERLEALQTETIAARKKLDQIAAKLSKARSKAASAIGEQVTFHMQELGMVGGQFIVEVSPSDKTHPG